MVRVLYQHEGQPDYREIYRMVKDLRDDIPFKQGQGASGLPLREYRRQREEVKARLRTQLAEYAPHPECAKRNVVTSTEPG